MSTLAEICNELNPQLLADMAPTFNKGQMLGERFEVEGHLKNAGQASVYFGKDQDTGKQVALKFPHIHYDPAVLGRVVREAEVTEAMSRNSKNSIGYVDSGTVNPFRKPIAYIATELMPRTLEGELTAAKGRLSLTRTVEVVAGVSNGVADLHDAQLVHRDIKPDNIFIDHDDEALIGDFGIVGAELEHFDLFALEAYKISPDVMMDDLTSTNAILGTPRNVPPEVMAGDSGHIRASDVFTLGLVADQMVTGKHLINSENFIDHATSMARYEAPKLETYDTAVPRDLARLVISCLEKDPNNRPTMKEVSATCASL